VAKITGVGWDVLSIDDSGGTLRDIRNDITNFDFATPRGVQDTTGVDKSAMERLLLLADMSVNVNGVVNFASNMSHDVFKTVPSTSVAREFSLGLTDGATTYSLGLSPQCALLFTDYTWSRAQSGELTFTAPGVLANGVVPTWSAA
jgi:hypothetical protein